MGREGEDEDRDATPEGQTHDFVLRPSAAGAARVEEEGGAGERWGREGVEGLEADAKDEEGEGPEEEGDVGGEAGEGGG